jgi:hypothetical protein
MCNEGDDGHDAIAWHVLARFYEAVFEVEYKQV